MVRSTSRSNRRPLEASNVFRAESGIHQFRLNYACGGLVDAPNEEALQHQGSIVYLHDSSAEEKAGQSLLQGFQEVGSSRCITDLCPKCKEAIRTVNNRQSSMDISDLLDYEPIYCHTISLKAGEVGRVSLPPYASKAELHGVTPLVWKGNLNHTPPHSVGEVEIAPFRETSYSSGSSSEPDAMRFSSLRKRTAPSSDLPSMTAPPISQVSEQAIDPIVSLAEAIMGVDSDSSKAPFSDKRKGKEFTKDTSMRTKRRTGKTSSGASIELWKLEFSACELNRQVMVADSSKDYDTSMALAHAVLLPTDVASLNEESSEAFRDLLVMQQVQRATILADCMKEQSVELKKAKKKVVEIHSKAFLEWWTTCLDDLGIPEDNLAWAKAVSTLEYPESPTPHSPLILPIFDKLKYMNRSGRVRVLLMLSCNCSTKLSTSWMKLEELPWRSL
ncbi:hypothetical protein Acr_07g0013530 [Actinidia rufa]|uniref:Uncharacterized protein n=1 Tax=Actinidia rufa TaxID=165716 RepID=A0A7J0EZV1_9ERIC|nr:hypothetical protein Acr_07g0013530 [Actinidia rufa]